MAGGIESVAVHGPNAVPAWNHTPFCTAYQLLISTWITGTDAFATKFNCVPAIGCSIGSPSTVIESRAALGLTATTLGALGVASFRLAAIARFTSRFGL